MDNIFKDLIIVELASVLAGPAVGMFFAELGATVIKIENATTDGDVTRTWKIKGEKIEGPAAYFYSVNYKKEVHLLNLKAKEDRAKVLQLIEKADILISNFSDSTSEKFELAYHQISSRFPKLIYAQLYGFASIKNRPVYDIVMQAESGFLSMSGTIDGQNTRMPVALIDVLAAHQLKEGILIALIKRYKTNKGSWVRTSLEESAIASLTNQATNYLMVNHIPKPMGTAHPNIAPYGDIFLTKDNKKIVLAVGSDKQFQSLCNILNLHKLTIDNDYSTNAQRVTNRDSLNYILAKSILLLNLTDLMKESLKHNIPVGHVKNLEEVFNSELAKKMILEEIHNGSKRVKTVAFTIE